MNWLRRTLAAASLLAGLVAPLAAYAQAPPPVPALPDTERRTSYSITASTCACSVGFALYGDSTDYQNWVEVFINGVNVSFNDPTFGWTLTSPTGPFATIPRPITDAILTFNQAQTGTIQIVGARRQRRTSQFQENRGVAARDLNQVITDIISVQREYWDKLNDVTGRGLFSQPGNTIGPLPLPTACANKVLGFDGTGLNPICTTSSGGGGSTNPGGLSGQIQYNNANVFGGVAGAKSNGTTVTFLNNDLILGGTSTGTTAFASANSGATNFTVTFPAATANLAYQSGAFASGQCLQASNTVGGIVTTGAACASSGTPGGSTTQVQYNNAGALGGITGVTTNGTLLTVANSDLQLAGSSTGVTTFTSANAGASNFTVTFPAATANVLFNVGAFVSGQCLQASGTVGGVATTGSACGGSGSVPGGSNTQLQYNNAAAFGGISGATSNGTVVTFANNDLLLGGSSTGTTTFSSANASASNFTITFPAATGTVALTANANVASVSNSDASLTISPTTGAVVASLNVAHANSWTAAQTHINSGILLLGSSTGATTFASANASASNFTVTFPAATANLDFQVGAFTNGHCLQASGTVGGVADSGAACGGTGSPGGSNTQLQYNNAGAFGGIAGATSNGTTVTFASSDLILAGTSTGVTTFASANASASNFTVTFPAATGNLDFQVGAFTAGHCLQASGTVGGIADSGTTCGGTGAPGGTSGSIQFNNSGSFGGLTAVSASLGNAGILFGSGTMLMLGSSSGQTTFVSANAGASNFTLTFPAATANLDFQVGAFTSGHCLQASGTVGGIADSGAACGGGGAVSSVANSDGSLTISPTTGAVVASLNPAHANSWSAIQTYSNSDIVLLGSSTGGTTFTSGNSTASNFTLTFPAATDQLVARATVDSLTNKTLASTTDTIGIVAMVLGADQTGDIWYRNAGGNLTRLAIGTASQVLTVSAGLPSWAAVPGTTLTVGTSVIASGTTTRVLFDNAGILGEYTLTGTGNNVVMQTSPTLVTPVLGVATGTSLQLGTASSVTGTLTLANSASAFTTTIQAGVNVTASRTYTWPTNFGAAGAVLTDAAGNGTLSWAATGTTGFQGALLPSSIYLGGGAGLIFPNFYIPATNTNGAGALEGVGVIASLTGDATAVLQFNMPELIPVGKTLKLRLLAMANATSGVAKLTVSDGATSAAANIGATTLTAETQTSQTWTTADVLVENKITLTTVPTANQILTVAIKFQTTGWTLAAASTWQASIVWE